MAALDKTLESMIARKVDLFSLKSGETPIFHSGRGSQPVGSNPLSAEKVLAYLRELAGPGERAALEAREAVSFTYRDFTISVVFPAGEVEAEIRPAAPQGGTDAVPLAAPESTQTPAPATAAAPRVQTAMELDRSFDPRAEGAPPIPIDELFREMIGRKASDLHLTMGSGRACAWTAAWSRWSCRR